jgi:hypothetical protein
MPFLEVNEQIYANYRDCRARRSSNREELSVLSITDMNLKKIKKGKEGF